MGLTKQYLAYKLFDLFNIIASPRCNVNFIAYENVLGRFAITAAAEYVFIWDLKFSKRVLSYSRPGHEVTAIRVSPDNVHVAIGYEDGAVEIIYIAKDNEYFGKSICSMMLHKSAITVLRYEENGLQLITGSLDTELVVVDMIEQIGKERLIGHNGPITDAHFFNDQQSTKIVISSSKDMQIKFWNIETECCFKTIVNNRTEIWSLALIGHLLIAGCSESNMNVYSIESGNSTNNLPEVSVDNEDTQNLITVQNCGVIQRGGKGRVVNLISESTGRFILCHGIDDLIEIYIVCTDAEKKQRKLKRLKKLKTSGDETQAANDENEFGLQDSIRRIEPLKVNEKIKSIDVLVGKNDELRILLSTAKNKLELYSISFVKSKKENTSLLCSLARPGHQTAVRSVCFTSDSLAIGSGAGDSFKIWNCDSLQCLRTVPVKFVLCCIFAPGDRYVLLGLKSGNLLIVDVSTGDVIEEIPAHEKELWSIAVLSDLRGCLSCSSDETVKYWEFTTISDTTDIDQLSLVHKRTLKANSGVLALGVSADIKYLAISLLDSTVSIFFFDTFKFFLSLYGHNLPVTCLDISDDCQVIVTGSADRYVKIWGMDFGDCQHTFFAHDDSVMSVRFIPNTHMFFSCGKDGKIKQWDADRFVKINTITGHIGEVYNLAISPNGSLLVSCGSDCTLRLFERTDEILVLQEVEEEERAAIENQNFIKDANASSVVLPGLKIGPRITLGSEYAVESIIECLEICHQFDSEIASGVPATLHPLMRALSASNSNEFLFKTLMRVRSNDLQDVLMMLPFGKVTQLLEYLENLLCAHKCNVEVLTKITIYLIKFFMKPILNNKELKPGLDKLLKVISSQATELRQEYCQNLHALYLLQHHSQEKRGYLHVPKKRKTKARSFKTVANII